jgi:membrane protein YqaA with SNARE-associated domain
MFFPASGWFAAFVLTLTVEVPIAGYLLRRVEPDRLRLAILLVFANLATHPIVWYVMTQLFLIGTWEYVLAAESWAIAVEAVFYAVAFRGLDPRRAIAIAAVANGASFIVGWIVGDLWQGVFG